MEEGGSEEDLGGDGAGGALEALAPADLGAAEEGATDAGRRVADAE